MQVRVILTGANGYMGHAFTRVANADPDVKVVAGVDVKLEKYDSFPMYLDPMEFGGEADVIVDFSVPASLDSLLRCVKNRRIPLVVCTTGHSAEQLDKLRETSRTIPVFRSGNMSLGINLTADLVRRAVRALGREFDVEIVERHHRRKVDAPSGTAIMLADAAASEMADKPHYTYERQTRREPRPSGEIGISAVRGGTIVGEHEIIFAGTDEVIEIRHSAYSRDVFAAGAVRAAKYMSSGRLPGMYDMTDVLGD